MNFSAMFPFCIILINIIIFSHFQFPCQKTAMFNDLNNFKLDDYPFQTDFHFGLILRSTSSEICTEKMPHIFVLVLFIYLQHTNQINGLNRTLLTGQYC